MRVRGSSPMTLAAKLKPLTMVEKPALVIFGSEFVNRNSAPGIALKSRHPNIATRRCERSGSSVGTFGISAIYLASESLGRNCRAVVRF